MSAAEATPRSETRGDRLPAVDEFGQTGGVPAAGGLRVLSSTEVARQGTRGSGHRDLPTQPRFGAAHRQEAADERPSRVRKHRARCRRRDRKSTRLNSSHVAISYAVFCLKKKRQ